jgi:hypothetical protein
MCVRGDRLLAWALEDGQPLLVELDARSGAELSRRSGAALRVAAGAVLELRWPEDERVVVLGAQAAVGATLAGEPLWRCPLPADPPDRRGGLCVNRSLCLLIDRSPEWRWIEIDLEQGQLQEADASGWFPSGTMVPAGPGVAQPIIGGLLLLGQGGGDGLPEPETLG